MSVLLSFSIFPTDHGASVSRYIARVERSIAAMGFAMQVTPMATVVETETMAEALSVLQVAHDALAEDCQRIYLSANMDVRQGRANRITGKLESLNRELDRLSKKEGR